MAGILLNSATDDEIEALKRLVAERGVLFFRRQAMTLAEHVEFGRRLGPLHFHPAADSAPGHPEAMRVFTEPDSTSVAGESWHSDVSCDEAPPALSILHMALVPKTGGDTLWASTYSAYETLSVPIRELIEGLEARHSSAHYYARRYGTAAEGSVYPEAVHPVVATHPISGRRALYVNSMFTSSILGLTSLESAALLKMLLDHVAFGVDFQVRMRWEPDTVAIWDNRWHPAPCHLGLLSRASPWPSGDDEGRPSSSRSLTSEHAHPPQQAATAAEARATKTSSR